MIYIHTQLYCNIPIFFIVVTKIVQYAWLMPLTASYMFFNMLFYLSL